MIKINDDYIIKTEDKLQYILCRVREVMDKDTGESKGLQYDAIGYYSTLENALAGLYDRLGKERLSDGIYTLSQAIEILRSTKNEIRAIAYGTGKDI